jgi:hypothetical protein
MSIGAGPPGARNRSFSMKALRNFAAATVLGAAVLALPLLQAHAAPTEATRAGSTTVVLDPGFLQALGSLEINPAPISPGRLVSSRLHGVRASFPITAGAVDLGAIKAEIAHSGGLSLSRNGTRVELTSFLIDLLGNGAPVLTGLVTVNDDLVGRLPLFDLALGTVGGDDDILRVRDVGVTLNAQAAAALSQVFGAAVPAGLPIGIASVRAILEFERH